MGHECGHTEVPPKSIMSLIDFAKTIKKPAIAGFFIVFPQGSFYKLLSTSFFLQTKVPYKI
jgi:hypothetical protein